MRFLLKKVVGLLENTKYNIRVFFIKNKYNENGGNAQKVNLQVLIMVYEYFIFFWQCKKQRILLKLEIYRSVLAKRMLKVG